MLSASIPNSHLASITSSPLFISVAESMVIFLPIFQLGCFSAWEGVTPLSSSLLLSLKGPPEAVSSSLFTWEEGVLPIHWKIAECSLSTGIIFTPFLDARPITSCPPATRDSLLASATLFPASRAVRVGTSPAIPTIPFSTISQPLSVIQLFIPSSPDSTTVRQLSPKFALSRRARPSSSSAATFGLNSLICCSINPSFSLAARAATLNSPSISLTTCSACRPMEPVLPKIAILFNSISPFLPACKP